MARKDSSGASAADGTAAPKQGRLKQFLAVYRLTARYDKKAPLLIFGTVVLVLAVSLTATFLLSGGWFSLVLGIVLSLMLALLAGLTVLTRRADKALFAQVEGKQGATSMALQSLRRGWTSSQEPVGADPRTGDLVFRAVGRPGIVLLVEGPLPRALRLAEAERKRHARVASGVPITVVHVGSGPDQTPLRKVAGRLTRLPRTLNAAEVSAVVKRLQALGGMRPPVPKGIDPMRARADRKAMRGR